MKYPELIGHVGRGREREQRLETHCCSPLYTCRVRTHATTHLPIKRGQARSRRQRPVGILCSTHVFWTRDCLRGGKGRKMEKRWRSSALFLHWRFV